MKWAKQSKAAAAGLLTSFAYINLESIMKIHQLVCASALAATELAVVFGRLLGQDEMKQPPTLVALYHPVFKDESERGRETA